MRRIEWCIVASFAIFTVSMSSLSYFLCFSFSSQSSNFLFSTGPPFFVVSFAEEDEVDEDDEVGEGVGQVRLRKNLKILVAAYLFLPESLCSVRRSAVPAEMMPAMPKSSRRASQSCMLRARRRAACMQWASTVHEGDRR